MYKINVETIDDIEIIKGFSLSKIDPVETKKKVRPIVSQLPDFENLSARRREIKSINKRIYDLDKLGLIEKGKFENNQLPEIDRENALKKFEELKYQWQVLNEELKSRKNEYTTIDKNLKQQLKNIFKQNVEYFQPARNEKLISKETYENFKSKFDILPPNKKLKSDGSEVDDFRGKIFFEKIVGVWNKQKIDKIGIAPGENSIESEQLSEAQRNEISDQFETERIAGLSDEQKQAEFEARKDFEAARAAELKNKLEIQGDPESLTKAQAVYNGKLEELQLKYNQV